MKLHKKVLMRTSNTMIRLIIFFSIFGPNILSLSVRLSSTSWKPLKLFGGICWITFIHYLFYFLFNIGNEIIQLKVYHKNSFSIKKNTTWGQRTTKNLNSSWHHPSYKLMKWNKQTERKKKNVVIPQNNFLLKKPNPRNISFA